MTLKALEVLKRGLKILQAQVKAKKEKLQAQLHERKSISSHDEKWLDNEANLVDEQQALDALENALDYERVGILNLHVLVLPTYTISF